MGENFDGSGWLIGLLLSQVLVAAAWPQPEFWNVLKCLSWVASVLTLSVVGWGTPGGFITDIVGIDRPTAFTGKIRPGASDS